MSAYSVLLVKESIILRFLTTPTGPLPREAFGASYPQFFILSPNFVVASKMYFKYIIKTIILPLKMLIAPLNLETWLRSWTPSKLMSMFSAAALLKAKQQ